MTKIGLWWTLKGEKKVKKITGKISRTILYGLLGLLCMTFIIYLISNFKWEIIFLLGGAFLLIFLIYSAMTWTE